MGGKPDQWEKGQMYVSDLKGYLGPKCKGSKAVQHDLVECYLLPLLLWKSTAARL